MAMLVMDTKTPRILVSLKIIQFIKHVHKILQVLFITTRRKYLISVTNVVQGAFINPHPNPSSKFATITCVIVDA